MATDKSHRQKSIKTSSIEGIVDGGITRAEPSRVRDRGYRRLSTPNRRSFIFGIAASGLDNLTSATGRPLVWQEQGYTLRGINVLQPFGWVVSTQGTYSSDPYINGGPFEYIIPEKRRALIRGIGFDFVRMPVDFGPLMSAADDVIFERLIEQIMYGIDRYIASGLKVLLVHFPPADLAVWPTVADGVAGGAFKRLAMVWQRLAKVVAARTDPTKVAVELFNEPPFPSALKTDPWLVQQKYLFDCVRAVLPTHSICVTSDSVSAIDRLVLLNPMEYDANTLFKFTGYEPLPFSQQGNGYWKYIHRLTFPPQEHLGGKTRAISDFIAAVDSDSTLSFLERTRTIHKFTSSEAREGIDTYFDTPCDAALIARRIQTVTEWASSQGVAPSRLIVGEFGARGDYQIATAEASSIMVQAASAPSQATFYETWRRQVEAAKLGAWCAHELNGPDGWSIALDKPPWTFRPDLLRALGLHG